MTSFICLFVVVILIHSRIKKTAKGQIFNSVDLIAEERNCLPAS